MIEKLVWRRAHEDVRQKLTCNSEAQLVVFVVVCKVILLHLLQVSRKFRVVQSIMRAVIEDVCGPVRNRHNRVERAPTIRISPRNDTVSP